MQGAMKLVPNKFLFQYCTLSAKKNCCKGIENSRQQSYSLKKEQLLGKLKKVASEGKKQLNQQEISANRTAEKNTQRHVLNT